MEPQEPVVRLLVSLRAATVVGLMVASTTGAAEASTPAFGVPISDRVVQAAIQLPDGKVATVEIREGTLLTVKNRDRDFMLGLSPAIDEVDGHVELLVVDIAEDGRSSDVQFMSQQALELGRSETIVTFLGDVEVRLIDVFVGEFPGRSVPESGRFRPKELEQQFGATSGGVCCVTCGPWTICGSSVTLSCGSCDSGGNSL